MKDPLKEVCGRYGILLEYNRNKSVILSGGYLGGILKIRAHEMWKGCTEQVAQAIAGYYSGTSDEGSPLALIKEYVKEIFGLEHYKIALPNIDSGKPKGVEKASAKNTAGVTSPMEMEILEISCRRFLSGRNVDLGEDGAVKAMEDDIMEFDVTVRPRQAGEK